MFNFFVSRSLIETPLDLEGYLNSDEEYFMMGVFYAEFLPPVWWVMLIDFLRRLSELSPILLIYPNFYAEENWLGPRNFMGIWLSNLSFPTETTLLFKFLSWISWVICRTSIDLLSNTWVLIARLIGWVFLVFS